jgi:2-polyprenyl-3-methyl-5-hydroxy-6-metoxy-1,4-benzoquinol methylase
LEQKKLSIKPKGHKDDITYKYSTDWIYSLETETHWRLYWRQQKIIQNLILPGDKVLEIGVGTGFTANYLRSKGVNVTTLDIDAEKKPDIVTNIVTYQFPVEYDHIVAFEVFEHIPFDQFKDILPKLAKATRKYLFMSVPRNEKTLIYGCLKLPKLPKWTFSLTVRRGTITSSHHFWEVDHSLTSMNNLTSALTTSGFHLQTQEKAFSRLFFVLQPVK